ncbi:MAG: hypothetical protein MI748_07650 [Opitutales bacterium]|nr:hypothetical protein [Opitutales bacterium]
MKILHLTSGDVSGEMIRESSLEGEVFVWHDLVYEGKRNVGWPTDETLQQRVTMLVEHSGAAMKPDGVLNTLRIQYEFIQKIEVWDEIYLWFDACLFDMSMLCHLIACIESTDLNLVVVDSYPAIEPFHGLGQLTPEQLASCVDRKQPVTVEMIRYAKQVDEAFATQDREAFEKLAKAKGVPLRWVPAAVKRWLEEFPSKETGLGRLEQMALEAIREGHSSPGSIFKAVAAKETPPQYWGDTSLWGKINGLTEKEPPLVKIEGPAGRLPQWQSNLDWKQFKVIAV